MKKITNNKSLNFLTLLLFIFSTLGYHVPSFHNHTIMEDLEEHLDIQCSEELSDSCHKHGECHESCAFALWHLNQSEEFKELEKSELFLESLEEVPDFPLMVFSETSLTVNHCRAPPAPAFYLWGDNKSL